MPNVSSGNTINAFMTANRSEHLHLVFKGAIQVIGLNFSKLLEWLKDEKSNKVR